MSRMYGGLQHHQDVSAILENMTCLSDAVEKLAKKIKEIADIAKDVGGDPMQSTRYMGLVEAREALMKVISISEGTYTYNIASKAS